MRRSLLAILAAAALAVAVAIASGAVTSNTPGPRARAGAATKMPMPPMPMPTAAGAAPASTSVQLHRRVVRVTIQNFTFLPARVVVSAGTRIVWTNQDSDPHTVTGDAPGGVLASAALDTGSRFAAVVAHAGTLTYHCTIHPYMHGTVVVQS